VIAVEHHDPGPRILLADSQDGSSRGNILLAFHLSGLLLPIIDALITNFHLPQIDAIMLVSALGGKDFLMKASRRRSPRSMVFIAMGCDADLIAAALGVRRT